MKWVRTIGLFCCFTLFWGNPIWAQSTEDVPQILLPQPNQPIDQSEQPSTAPADTATEPVPEIQLVPPAAAEEVIVEEQVPLVEPEPTEVAELAVAAPVRDWLLPLVPSISGPPGQIRIGASLPELNILRLTGERASVHMNLYLPAALPAGAELQLSLRSSINALPENASIEVQINEAESFEAPLTNLTGFGTVAVPGTGLKPGRNQVTVTVIQPHRIFCGPDASFGVWTEIDLAGSGVKVSPDMVPLDGSGFLAALYAQSLGGQIITVQADEGINPQLAAKAVSAVAATLGQPIPDFELKPFYTNDTAGTARISLIPADQPQAAFRRAADGAIVLQIDYVGDRLPDLAPLLSPVASKPAPIAMVTPGVPTSLDQLGLPGFVGNTHYFRQDVQFRLPDDWLLLANQKANLTLHYGFAADLAAGSVLLVKMNERSIQLLPLDRDGGAVLPPLDIRFPASLLNPGRNILSFEMVVPGDPPDAACIVRQTDMLAVLGDTSLDVPTAPKMILPGLVDSLANLQADTVMVPPDAPGRQSLEAQLLPLLVALQSGSGSDIPVTLNVVRADGAELVPLGQLGVSWRAIQKAILPVTATLQTTASTTPTLNFRLSQDGGNEDQPVDSAPGVFAAPWQQLLRFVSTEGWTARQILALEKSSYLYNDGALADWLSDKKGLALLLRPDPSNDGNLWLVVSPEAHMADVARGIDRLRRNGLAHGDAALLQPEGNWLVWSDIVPPKMVEPLSVRNLRAAIGNYASWSPLLFACVTLVLAALSAIPALLYIIITRRRGGGL